MNRDEAKRILALHRSERLDQDDSEMQAALQLAQTDPELSAWAKEAQSAHEANARHLNELPVPRGLKDSILAGKKVVKLAPWKRREFIAALAASAALVAGGTFWWVERSNEQRELARFQNRMLEYAVRSYGMDILTNDAGKVRSFLASKSAPSDFPLPPRLAELPVVGGAKLSFEGRPVSMVCFKLGGDTSYLFVMDSAGFRGAPGIPAIQFGRFYELSKALWASEKEVFLLGAKIPEDQLKALLSGGA